MSWNYRVIAKEYKDDVEFYIHEVYYDADGNPNGYTKEPVPVSGACVKDIKWTLKHMKKAMKKPVLVDRGEGLIIYKEKPNK